MFFNRFLMPYFLEKDLNNDLMIDKGIIEPLLKKQNGNSQKEDEKIDGNENEIYEIYDDKLIPSIMHKRKNNYNNTINKKEKVQDIASENEYEEYANLIHVKNNNENNKDNDNINEINQMNEEEKKGKEKNILIAYIIVNGFVIAWNI